MSEEPTGRELDAAIAELRGMDTMQGQYSDWLISSPDSPTWNRLPEWHGKDAMELLTWWIEQGFSLSWTTRYEKTTIAAKFTEWNIQALSDTFPCKSPDANRFLAQAIYRALKAQQENS